MKIKFKELVMKRSKEELAVYQERGISIESVKKSELKYCDALQHARLMANKNINVPCIPISYPDINGRMTGYIRTKLLGEYFQDDSKKPAKYLQKSGSTSRLYFSTLVAWSVIAGDSSVPIIFVEGEFKAIKACQEGLHAIAVSGVWNWRKRGDDKDSSPISCFNLINWKQRTVYICFDSDGASNKQVRAAELALAQELFNRGAEPRIIRLPTLPGQSKTGLDDFIVTRKGKWKKEWEVLLKDASYPCTVKTVSSVEISNTEYKEPIYIINGLLSSGMTTFSGAPKSGKSWAAIAIGHAVAVAGTVFGKYKVSNSGPVLYCALEDTPRRIKSRLADMKLIASDNLNFAFSGDLKQGDDGCLMLDRWCEKNPNAKLIIVDTLQKFRAPTSGRQSAYESDYAALGAIKNIADRYGVAVLLIHHLRKAKDDDVFAQVSGSTAITGAADTNIVLIRERSKDEAFLHVTGRDIEDQEIAMRFHSGVWTAIGMAKDFRVSQVQQYVLDAIKMHGKPATPSQIASLMGRKASSMTRLLSGMCEKGLLKWSEGGYYSLDNFELKSNPKY